VPLTKSLVIAALLLAPAATIAQQPDRKESAAVLELGGAGAWNLKNAASGFGPTVAVEVTPIEHWLELEAGVTPLFSRHSTEWSADLLFKKPWRLSRKIEFMAGAGPEWIHTRESGTSANSAGAPGGARLHVLALSQASRRLVSRTDLRVQIRAGPRAFSRRQWRNFDGHPVAFFSQTQFGSHCFSHLAL